MADLIPRHLTSHCSDVQLKMTHIVHPNKQQEYFEVFRNLKQNETFTDVIFVTKDNRRMAIHKLVLISYSQFLKSWFESTFAPDLQYTILLPDVDYTDLEVLCHILYGVDIAVPRSRFEQIYNVAEMLGISMSKMADQHRRGQRVSLSSTSSAPSAQVELEVGVDPPRSNNENMNVDELPLLCFHCDKSFPELEVLQKHAETHKGEKFKSKRHKCQKCKKILPSMWKLRTHLLTHKQKTIRRSDHEYAGPSKPDPPARKTESDHPYATPNDSTPAPQQQAPMGPEKRLAQRVRSEHSYGTRRKTASMSEDAQQQQAQPVQVVAIEVIRDQLPPPGSSVLAQAEVVQEQQQQQPEPQPPPRPLRPQQPPSVIVPASGADKSKKEQVVKTPVKAFPDKSDGKTAFNCEYCDKMFPKFYRKKRHIEEVHHREVRHKCKHCDKGFYKVSSKVRHELTHVTHDLWNCPSCLKKFKDESSLKYHVKKDVCKLIRSAKKV